MPIVKLELLNMGEGSVVKLQTDGKSEDECICV